MSAGQSDDTHGSWWSRVHDPKDRKVTLCHATGSESNPWVLVTVSKMSVLKGGHGRHGDDVIPPFPGFEGQNWPT